MMDNRQLLRTSRTHAATLCFISGVILIVLTLREIAWHIEALGMMYVPTAPIAVPAWSDIDWTLVTLIAQLAVGFVLVFRRNWLARKLIKPVRDDTCPSCDYPIGKDSSTCPECGLQIRQEEPSHDR